MNPQRHAQVKQLFLQAVELEPDRRAQFLDEHCRGDAALRGELETLLAHHHQQTVISPHNARVPTAVRISADEPAPPARGRRLGRKGLSPGRYLVVGVLAAAALLTALGLWQWIELQGFLDRRIEHLLTSLLDAKTAALTSWLQQHKAMVQSWTREPQLVSDVQQLVALAGDPATTAEQLNRAPQANSLRQRLGVLAGDQVKYAIWDRRNTTIADWSVDGAGLGTGVTTLGGSLLARVVQGETLIISPVVGQSITLDYPYAAERPHLLVFTPVRDAEGRIIATLLLYNLGLFDVFSKMLQINRLGETGETYVFNREAVMLSESRFNDQLRALGMIPEGAGSFSSSRVVLRDPGIDLLAAARAGKKPDAGSLPPEYTLPARSAISGINGCNIQGYRNYLGQRVVGAWKWFPDSQVGLAIEIGYDEVYETTKFIQRMFHVSFALLIVAALGLVGSGWWISLLRRQVGLASRLGQYTLQQQLGSGGMGCVYLARHALLKRPVAIKLLKPELVNPRTVKWFQREVQLASQLTHPNTIEIYDFGTSDEGVFYYVMEYLPGRTLGQLAESEGRIPWARVVFLLRQVCGSLGEAHRRGMVHRDIKPQNIMLCERGGQWDFVKVLDFGLVKEMSPAGAEPTGSLVLAGSPMYMAPERMLDPGLVDPRSDVYAVGAVAYRLLTGEAPRADTSAGLLDAAMDRLSRPSQQVAGIPAALDQLVSRCLHPDMRQRPSIDQLDQQLSAIEDPTAWNRDLASRWWQAAGSQAAAAETKSS